MLDAPFKAISSLIEEVSVDVNVYDDEGLSDDLRKKMCDCGWTIKVTKLDESWYNLVGRTTSSIQTTSSISTWRERENEA